MPDTATTATVTIKRIHGSGESIPTLADRSGEFRKWVRLLLRLKLDKPFGRGGDPSEVRLSVLSSINPTILGEILGFGRK